MKLWCVVVCLLWLSIFPAAASEYAYETQLEVLWEEAEGYGISPENTLEEGTSHLWRAVQRELGDFWKSGLRTGCKLLLVVLLCTLAEQIDLSAHRSGGRVTQMAGAAAITALAMTDVDAMIGLGRETIGKIELFSRVLLPAMATVSAATGQIQGAALRQGATVLFSQLLLSVMDRLLIPLVYCYVAVSCAQAAVGNDGLSKLAGLLKGMVTFVLTGLLVAFVGYLTASGAVAGSVDAAKVKAAKLAISRVVPVVGGILADASETLLAGAGMLRSTVGIVGVLVVLAICLTPFLHLAMQYLVYKGTAALCAILANSGLCRLIETIGGAFGLVLGMTGASALILLVSLISAISVVRL